MYIDNIRPIQLTKEQKNHLLEMCRLSFPEREWSLTDSKGFINCWTPGIDMEDSQETRINDEQNIHWFEFCYYYLSYKLFDSEDNNMYNDDCTEHDLFFGGWTGHLVDFLYDKFKTKINNEK